MGFRKAKADEGKLVESVVVFADALGTKAYLLNPKSAVDFVGKIKTASDAAARRLNVAERLSAKTMSHRWFSDCLCLRVSFNDHDGIIGALKIAAQLQLEFLLSGVFLRGGAAVGLHYHSEHIDLGPALVEAAELERISVYPAIFLTRTLIDRLWHADRGITDLLAMSKSDQKCFLNFFPLLEDDSRQNARDQITAAIWSVTIPEGGVVPDDEKKKAEDLRAKYL